MPTLKRPHILHVSSWLPWSASAICANDNSRPVARQRASTAFTASWVQLKFSLSISRSRNAAATSCPFWVMGHRLIPAFSWAHLQKPFDCISTQKTSDIVNRLSYHLSSQIDHEVAPVWSTGLWPFTIEPAEPVCVAKRFSAVRIFCDVIP